MPDPRNRADLPASWLPEATQVTPKPAGYQRAVARKVKNRRHARVLDMATLAEDMCRRADAPLSADRLESLTEREWKALSAAAGHPATVPSAETRACIIDKVRADLAEPYRAKGRAPMP